jgi:hypothetical protein
LGFSLQRFDPLTQPTEPLDPPAPHGVVHARTVVSRERAKQPSRPPNGPE